MKSTKLTEVLVIRLPKGAVGKLKKIAASKGLNLSTLVRMWIMEKLQQQLRKGSGEKMGMV